MRAVTLFKDGGTKEPGVERVYVIIETTTSGTIEAVTVSGTVSRWKCSVTPTKTGSETGRYTLTFTGYYVRLLGGSVLIEGTADAAAATSAASTYQLRGNSPSTGVVYVQMKRSDTNADAEVEDGAIIRVTLDISMSKALDR